MRALGRGHPRRQLQASVAELSLARRRAEALHLAAWGAAIGGLIAGLISVGAAILGRAEGPLLASSLLLGAIVVAAVVGWLRTVPEERIALEVDRRLGLGERLTTALEIIRTRSSHPLAEQQLGDTLAHLASVHPGAVYPLQLPRRVRGLILLGLLLAVAPWVVPWPRLPLLHPPVSRTVAVARAEADRLDDVARQLEAEGSAANQPLRSQLATQLRQAAGDLRRDGASVPRATRDLLQAEQRAAALAPQTGEDASLTLARISDALSSQALTKPVSQALDQQNVSQATAALGQLADNLSNLSADQRNELASALQAASNAARGSETTAAQQLQQAAQAARNGDRAGLAQAAQALRQLGQASQAQQTVARARSELQASQQAIADAAQAGAAQPSSGTGSQDPAANGQDAAGSPSAQADSGAAGGPTSQGDQPGGQQAGGIGKGSTDHLGSPHDVQDLAQRQITVPTDQLPDDGAVSASDQLQVGAGGEAQVDYRNVLPQYQKQALQAIEENAVPSGMKQIVKGYFDSLAAR